MNTFFSTFISGFGDLIKQELPKKLPNLKVNKLLDGLITYQSTSPVIQIKDLRFFNNSFIFLHQFSGDIEFNPSGLIKRLLKEFDFELISIHVPQKQQSFRIVISQENQIISIDKSMLNKLEKRIQQSTRLDVDRSSPDIEFWLLIRREDLVLFGLRISKHTAYKKTLRPGELRPQLAYLLCLLSEPKKRDKVLDPFCGYGAIVLERAKYFPYSQIYAGDKDTKLIQELIRKSKGLEKMEIKKWDALDLKSIPDNSINKIITDPPWGIYEQVGNLTKFYQQMLNEFGRVLIKSGEIIILSSAKSEFESVLKLNSHFNLLNQYHILVSGKKAGVYKLQKF